MIDLFLLFRLIKVHQREENRQKVFSEMFYFEISAIQMLHSDWSATKQEMSSKSSSAGGGATFRLIKSIKFFLRKI